MVLPIHLGASFNMSLVHLMAETKATEARGFSNEGRAGLVFFTPNINIFRRLIVNIMQRMIWKTGMELSVFNLMLVSVIKIFLKLVYVMLSLLVLCITSNYCSVRRKIKDRCSFQKLSFDYFSEAYHLDGIVVSDCSAVQTIMTGHNYTQTVQDTVAVALHAGTDINCGTFYSEYAQQAFDNKTIVEDDIDQAVIRAFTVLVRLGYFDPPEQQPYRQITKDAVDTNRSRQLALEAVEQGIILLKTVKKALPLNLKQLP
jgi:beta-D-xylosidase 4